MKEKLLDKILGCASGAYADFRQDVAGHSMFAVDVDKVKPLLSRWNKIKDAEDLPKTNGDYFWLPRNGGIPEVTIAFDINDPVSHYVNTYKGWMVIPEYED